MVALVAVVGVVVVSPADTPATAHASPEGGFGVTLPRGWVVTAEGDGGSAHAWLSAERPIRLGGGASAWMWIARFPTGAALDERRAELEKEYASRHAAVTMAGMADRPAVRVRYEQPVAPVRFLPGSATQKVIYETIVDGRVYQLGIGGWPTFPDHDAAAIVRSFSVSPPRGWRTVEQRPLAMRVALPAVWEVIDDEASGAAIIATDGSSPAGAWLYVWESNRSVPDGVERARRNITAKGGRDIVEANATVDGYPATRLDFLFPNTVEGMPPMAADVEWFVDRSVDDLPNVIIAVGRNDPSSSIAGDVIARVSLRPAT